jgi:hypothetical protein
MSAIKALSNSLLIQMKKEGKIYSVKKEEFLKEKGDYLGYNVDETPVLAIFIHANGVETFSFSGGWNHYLLPASLGIDFSSIFPSHG